MKLSIRGAGRALGSGRLSRMGRKAPPFLAEETFAQEIRRGGSLPGHIRCRLLGRMELPAAILEPQRTSKMGKPGWAASLFSRLRNSQTLCQNANPYRRTWLSSGARCRQRRLRLRTDTALATAQMVTGGQIAIP